MGPKTLTAVQIVSLLILQIPRLVVFFHLHCNPDHAHPLRKIDLSKGVLLRDFSSHMYSTRNWDKCNLLTPFKRYPYHCFAI